MRHDGRPWSEQCEGCTFRASQMQRPGTTGRGCEVALWSYGLIDMTVAAKNAGKDSPAAWPRIPDDQHQWRVDGRPTAQWAFTDQDVSGRVGRS